MFGNIGNFLARLLYQPLQFRFQLPLMLRKTLIQFIEAIFRFQDLSVNPLADLLQRLFCFFQGTFRLYPERLGKPFTEFTNLSYRSLRTGVHVGLDHSCLPHHLFQFHTGSIERFFQRPDYIFTSLNDAAFDSCQLFTVLPLKRRNQRWQSFFQPAKFCLSRSQAFTKGVYILAFLPNPGSVFLHPLGHGVQFCQRRLIGLDPPPKILEVGGSLIQVTFYCLNAL